MWETEINPVYQTYVFPEELNIEGIIRIKYRMPGTPDVWYELENKSYRVYGDKVQAPVPRPLWRVPLAVHVPDAVLPGDQPR